MSPAKKKTSIKKKVAVKTAAKKTASKKTATKKTTGKKAAKQQSGKNKPDSIVRTGSVSPEQRWKMIAEAAYHRAEKRGFESGHELEDWTAAEKEIDGLLSGQEE